MDFFRSICTDIITLVSLILDSGMREQFIQIIEFIFVLLLSTQCNIYTVTTDSGAFNFLCVDSSGKTDL